MLAYILANPLILFGSTVAIYILYLFLLYLTDHNRSIPGPFLARFTRCWELKQTYDGHFETVNIDLHRKHGPIVRLAPSRYSVSDPTSIKVIYGHGSKFVKSNYYHAFPGPVLLEPRDIFTEPDPQVHAATRRRHANLYAMSTLVSYEPYVDSVNDRLIEKLDQFVQQRTTFDLFTWMQFYAFDVIGEISFGRSFGLLEAGGDNGLLEAIDYGNIQYSPLMGLIPEFHRPYIRSLKLLRIPNRVAPVQTHIQKEIMARKAGDTTSDREDFMTKCLRLMKEGKMESHDVNRVVGANVGAGSDTTGISLTAVLYYLTQTPSVLQRLRQELDESDAPHPIAFARAQKLPYLNAVIKEALRMHPGVGAILPRIVPEGGVEIAGHLLPAGAAVGMNAWVVHQDTSVFGNDSQSFNPERWLNASKEQRALMEQSLLSFGAGSRTCIGKNISRLEMSKIIPQIVRRFDLHPSGAQEWTTRNGWFVKQKWDVSVSRRSQAPNKTKDRESERQIPPRGLGLPNPHNVNFGSVDSRTK